MLYKNICDFVKVETDALIYQLILLTPTHLFTYKATYDIDIKNRNKSI